MMKLKDFKLLLFLIFFPVFSYAQVSVFGKVNDKQTSIGLASVEIYNELGYQEGEKFLDSLNNRFDQMRDDLITWKEE